MIAVFVDSDVIISSLLSSTGAAYLLINQTDNLSCFISTLSEKELRGVAERLSIDLKALQALIKHRFTKTVFLDEKNIKKHYAKYVLDIHDAHIVAGAEKAQVRFVISYNVRHFKVDKIKEDLGIIVTTPAAFLQYLRSLQ